MAIPGVRLTTCPFAFVATKKLLAQLD